MNPLAALVLVAGVRLVDRALPTPSVARAADDPREVRDRLVRAAALTAALLLARRVGRGGGRRGARGRRGRGTRRAAP